MRRVQNQIGLSENGFDLFVNPRPVVCGPTHDPSELAVEVARMVNKIVDMP